MNDSPGVQIEVSDTDTESAWSVVLVGDCIYQEEMASDPLGTALRGRIAESDLALVNMEAPVSVDREAIDKSGPAKESAADAPDVLASSGFGIACLANNHTMDFGPEGLRATQHACAAAGIETVGAGETIDEALSPLFVALGRAGPTLGIINVCEQEFGIANDDPGTAWLSHPAVDQCIDHATATADIVIVVAHGGIEYVPFPPPERQQTLRSFVDRADAVIGHHPHVPQGWEIYDGCPIVYSLGNFLFEQSARPSTNWGLAVTLSGHGSTLTTVTPVLTEQRDATVYEMDNPTAQLAYLHRATEIIGDRASLEAHWQELAVRMFEQRYTNWLQTGVDETGTWDATEHRTEMLTLLNIVRNESHREVIETALSVKTGDSIDRRTPEIRQTVRELLSWTEDRPVYE